jgi:hypothetical protein
MLFEIALRFDWIKFKLLIVIMHIEYILYKFFRIAHGVGSYKDTKHHAATGAKKGPLVAALFGF